METAPQLQYQSEDDPQLYTFKSFMKIPTHIFNVIGLIFWPKTSYRDYKWSGAIFFTSIFGLSLAVFCEGKYEYEFFKMSTNLKEGTAVMVYLLYTILSEFKLLYIFNKIQKLNRILMTLNDFFPSEDDRGKDYDLKKCRRRMLLLTIPVIVIVWSNVCFYTMSSLYMYFFTLDRDGGDLRAILQFYFWYPFEINSSLRLLAAILHQCHASQVVVLSNVGSEALLTCIMLQICMHLDALSTRLRRRHSGIGDIKDLSYIVKNHGVILQLVEDVNEVYSIPIFITFVLSMFVTCFVGFQVINGSNGLEIINFGLLLAYELMKVFQTSLIGDMLTDSSIYIGVAAYNTNWYENSVQYQKIIKLIICRSQKPANLNALTYHSVGLISFKQIMAKSYTFFTLLHTMYNT